MLPCDLSIRAERYFSSFLTFRVLGRMKLVKSFLTLVTPVPSGKLRDYGSKEACHP